MSAVFRQQQILPVSKPALPTSIRLAIGLAGLLLLLVVGFVLSRLASDPARFPVLNVDVAGTVDYADRQELQQRVQSFTSQGFYGLDVDEVRESVESLPWVSKIHVRRMWPGRLMVSVEEHEPAARFNNDALVSKTMEVFKPPQLQLDNPQYLEWRENFASLPKLAGAEGRHEAVLDAYRHYQQSLSLFGVSIDALVEDERRSQTLTLSNAVTVRLGYESHELRLQRFIDVYERLVVPLKGEPARFDMRYSNGFAFSGAIADQGNL